MSVENGYAYVSVAAPPAATIYCTLYDLPQPLHDNRAAASGSGYQRLYCHEYEAEW